jgi:hypothetical protein
LRKGKGPPNIRGSLPFPRKFLLRDSSTSFRIRHPFLVIRRPNFSFSGAGKGHAQSVKRLDKPEMTPTISPQAASRKPQAASRKPQAASRKPQAASRKPQAASRKPQAASHAYLAADDFPVFPKALFPFPETGLFRFDVLSGVNHVSISRFPV